MHFQCVGFLSLLDCRSCCEGVRSTTLHRLGLNGMAFCNCFQVSKGAPTGQSHLQCAALAHYGWFMEWEIGRGQQSGLVFALMVGGYRETAVSVRSSCSKGLPAQYPAFPFLIHFERSRQPWFSRRSSKQCLQHTRRGLPARTSIYTSLENDFSCRHGDAAAEVSHAPRGTWPTGGSDVSTTFISFVADISVAMTVAAMA